MFGSLFGGGCRIEDIREVDWRATQTREFDYGVISYWFVDENGGRSFPDRQEGFGEGQRYGPDYTYTCISCGENFWHWSDVR